MPTRSERLITIETASRSGRWVLKGARIPAELVGNTRLPGAGDGLVVGDILVSGSKIAGLAPPGTLDGSAITSVAGAIILPGLIDCHTHLDKGHIWPRAANPDGSFAGAIGAVSNDQAAYWSQDDICRRMDFALRCAYAHGTVAIRSHLDCWPDAPFDIWPLMRETVETWHGKIDLCAAALIGISDVEDDAFMDRLVREIKATPGAALGAFVRAFPEDQSALPARLDRLFRLADTHGLALDFHVDETTDPSSRGLAMVAEAALRAAFQGPILCGHCCAIASYEVDLLAWTLDLTARAGIGIVSLPLCNAYLLDRIPGRTPRQRAMTPLHEIRAAGIALAIASDNTRDPFNACGDLDLLEVLRFATVAQHLDHPVGDWPAAISATPARLIGQEERGALTPGGPADLIILPARSWSEMNARPQTGRIVLRNGLPIDTTLPDYSELDDLEGFDEFSDS